MKKVIKYFAILLAVSSIVICLINLSKINSQTFFDDTHINTITDEKIKNIDIQIARIEANKKASEDLETCFFCTITLIFSILLCVKYKTN